MTMPMKVTGMATSSPQLEASGIVEAVPAKGDQRRKPVAITQKGAAVLDSADPKARFGYCGVWPGSYSPELMSRSGYLGLYSPGHLYNLNVWLGIEREIGLLGKQD